MAPSRRAHHLGQSRTVDHHVGDANTVLIVVTVRMCKPDGDAHSYLNPNSDTDTHTHRDANGLPVGGSLIVPVTGHLFLQRAGVGCSAGVSGAPLTSPMAIRLRQLTVVAVIVATTAGPVVALKADTHTVATPTPSRANSSPSTNAARLGPAPHALTVPDLAVVVPGGATASQLSAIRKLHGVRALLTVDGGQVRLNGHIATVLGVPMPAFRAWTPPVTAAATGVWAILNEGNMVAAAASAKRLGISLGHSYPVAGTDQLSLPLLATAPLGIPGADAVVSSERGAQLGLTRDVMVLVNAPDARYDTLATRIRHITGPGSDVITLVPVVRTGTLPVLTVIPAKRPANYLQLYQAAAAGYCPGLSWTVLAAIGQIESGDGANDGPSSAGALGPMQFMPATWAEWGIDGFGDTGRPDIMNPYDAVPSAARMLCADGARAGAAGLSSAIYDYNHATWYVGEVLDLAAEYAQEYSQPSKDR